MSTKKVLSLKDELITLFNALEKFPKAEKLRATNDLKRYNIPNTNSEAAAWALYIGYIFNDRPKLHTFHNKKIIHEFLHHQGLLNEAKHHKHCSRTSHR